MCLLDHALDMREPAFAVVGEDHGVELGERALVVRELRRQNLVRGRGLEIDTQQLLLACDHAQFDGRRKRRVTMQRGPHLIASEQALERSPGFVVADNTHGKDGDSQIRQIADGIARAAGHHGPLTMAQDQYRSFTRDA